MKIRAAYEEAKRKAKETYSKIGRIYSPRLHDMVSFNNIGFKHLIRKGSAMRPLWEQINRFALLGNATRMLKDPHTNISVRQSGNTQFWAFHERKDNVATTLIIRQVGKGRKHFFSIFKKQKSAQ